MENKHPNSLYNALIIISYLLLKYADSVEANSTGQWTLLLDNTGVVATHMALTHYNTVVMFDQAGPDRSRLQLRRRFNSGRRCYTRDDFHDSSCYAHSVEYDVASNKIRALDVESDTWCSSGSMLSNGTLIQTGGFGSGSRRIRYFEPCGDGRRCDWKEGRRVLAERRWFASSLRLAEREDRVIVLGGINVFSYEFVPKQWNGEKSFHLPFLRNTYDKNEGGNNLYPIIHLSSDNHLFIFANRDSILFNYKRNTVVKTFPRIHGKGSRSYPSTGSSVILPLDHKNGFAKTEVMICGGGAFRAFTSAKEGQFLKGLSTCGRMVITGNIHIWKMENMPESRLMSDMIVLQNGHILIINGVKNGSAGVHYASDPALEPYLYDPKKPLGKRFKTLKSTKIARMYPSSAILLPDGRVLVGGSNPNHNYVFKNAVYPSELRLQAFSPPNMGKEFDDRRAHNVTIKNSEGVGYAEEFTVEFLLKQKSLHSVHEIEITVYATPFNTHSLSMNQRMLKLWCKKIEKSKRGWLRAVVKAPPSMVAPSGYYMLSVVNSGIPSRSQWVRFIHK